MEDLGRCGGLGYSWPVEPVWGYDSQMMTGSWILDPRHAFMVEIGKRNENFELWIRSLWKEKPGSCRSSRVFSPRAHKCPGIFLLAQWQEWKCATIGVAFSTFGTKNEATFEVRLDKTCPGDEGMVALYAVLEGLGIDRKLRRRLREELNLENVTWQGRCVEQCDSTYTVYTWMIWRSVERNVCI